MFGLGCGSYGGGGCMSVSYLEVMVCECILVVLDVGSFKELLLFV